jgi:RNA polymerase sigma-70 factor (ECF subfamily)
MQLSETQSDYHIARRILAGDEAAFRDVFDRLFPKLYRFALVRLRGNPDEAAEVVQRTFCRSFERLASYRGEASLYSWMCQICRNAIADLGREKQREPVAGLALEEEQTIAAILESLAAPAIDEPEVRAWRVQLMQLIQATLDCLPDRYGDVLEWKYVDGLSVKEIAARLAIGPKAAESLIMRARTAFREAIGDLGESAESFGARLP